MSLELYKQKRDFKSTPEPDSGTSLKKSVLTFVVQRHDASHLHYDFRLEMEGVLKSWAIPKGPSMLAGERRLAIMVEDHPLPYGAFYGEIPAGNYGAGTVEIWDEGAYMPLEEKGEAEENLLDQLDKGNIKIVMNGHYLKGGFALIRITGKEKENEWLLIKKKDEYALTSFNIDELQSVKSTNKEPLSVTEDEGVQLEQIKKDQDMKEDFPTEEVVNESKNHISEKKVKVEEMMTIGGKKVKCTNLTKVYWPEEGYTKGDLISYYLSISKYILPYLKNRPQSLNRHPNGIKGKNFYQKDMDVSQLPSWIKTVKVYSKSNEELIDYMVCNDAATLIYMANLGCIEINPWHSTYLAPDEPTYIMLDLDPGDIPFTEVVNTALMIKEICDKINIPAYCKTSGAAGLHIYIPLAAKYSYSDARTFAQLIATITNDRLPTITSIERSLEKRKNKVYIDYMQNSKSQTIASAYSVRPRAMATVSTPLDWKEVNHQLTPQMFTIQNLPERLNTVGDLWEPVLKKGIVIAKALKALEKL